MPGFPNTAAHGPETSDKARSCSVETPSVISTEVQKPMTGCFQNLKRPYKRINKQFSRAKYIISLNLGQWPTKVYTCFWIATKKYNSREQLILGADLLYLYRSLECVLHVLLTLPIRLARRRSSGRHPLTLQHWNVHLEVGKGPLGAFYVGKPLPCVCSGRSIHQPPKQAEVARR